MIKSSFNKIKKRIFGKYNRREYEDMIRLSSVFQKQKEELNILFRHSNFLVSHINSNEITTIKEKYKAESQTKISSSLFSRVFDGLKTRSFAGDPDSNIYIDSIKKKEHTYSRALFEAQEKEIELLFHFYINHIPCQ